MGRLYYNDGQAASKLNTTAAEIETLVERGLLQPVHISTGRLFLASEIEHLPPIKRARDQKRADDTKGCEFPARSPAYGEPKEEASDRKELDALLSNPWTDLLSTRTRTCLREAKITTLAELRDKTPDQLFSIRGFGDKALEEVNWFLKFQDLPQEGMNTVGEAKRRRDGHPLPNGGLTSDVPFPPLRNSFSDAPISSNNFVHLLSTRTRTCLHRASISSLSDLRHANKASLMRIQGFGVKCLREVEAFLNTIDLPMKPDRPAQEPSLKVHEGRARADEFAEKARALLQKFGVREDHGLQELDLRQVLEATGYDEKLTDAVWYWYGLPTPRDEQDLLALLAASDLAKSTLRHATDFETDKILDDVAKCLKIAEDQITAGTLHERATMDWSVLQALNVQFGPPASTLPELLDKLGHSPESTAPDAIRKLEEALDLASLDEELGLLLASLTTREAETLRQRLTPTGQGRTLKELGEQLGVSRERVRQIEKQASEQLRHLYYWEQPLPRTRTAMILIRERGDFAMENISRLLRERGLTASDEIMTDLIVVWRALDLSESGVHSTLQSWRAVDPRDYTFPEEILSVARTGLTPRQQALEKEVLRAVRKLVRRVGAATLSAVREAIDDQTAAEEDVIPILTNYGFSEISSGYWSQKRGYSILREAAAKMVAFCGPLDLRQLRRGILRHQRRLDYPVLPPQLLGAALGQHDDLFEVSEEGIISLRDPNRPRPSLGRWERVWLRTVEDHGPVVHAHSILRAFAENNLSSITAQVLMTNSTLVERVDKQLFCLPGALFTDAEVEAGRGQATQRGWAGRQRSTPAHKATPRTTIPTPAPQSPESALEERDTLLEVPAQQAYEGLRGHLRYDSQENRLAMVVPEAVWPGDATVRLTWDDRDISVPSVYSASDDFTTSRALELPTRGAGWEAEARMASEGGSRTVRLPRPSRDRGLVFGTTSGRAVERWRSGENYYVVVPVTRFSDAWAETIFDEWHRLGRPEGWPEHLALRVRVGNPFGNGGEAASVIERYGRATGALGLPGLEHLWRPRGRLVGAPVAASGVGDAFRTQEPPHLEVSGLWDSSLAVSLARWEPKKGEFVERDALIVPVSPERTLLVALWGGNERPQEGRYRIEVGENSRTEFELVGTLPPAELHGLEVRLGLEGEPVAGRALRRRDLDRGTLVGHAWPATKLTLRASCGTWSLSFGATADEEGCWSARWRDLGARDVPEGPVQLALSWRGLVEARLVFADDPRVDPEDVALRWRGRGARRFLALEGHAYGAQANVRARAVLLGPRPWAGEVWSESLPLDEHGGFEARFRPEGEIRWLAILPDAGPEAINEGVHPWLVEAQDENAPLERYPLDDLRGARPELWEGVAAQLRRAPLPPALERLLDLSALGRVLESQGPVPASGPRWRPADDRETLERLAGWVPFGLRAPIALFSAASPLPAERLAEPASSCLTVEARDLAAAMAGGGGEIPVGCATPDGNLRRLTSRAVLREEGSGWALELRAGEQLHACPRCGLVLPPGEFWNHRPPSPGMRPCAEGRRALRMIGAGRNEPVRPLLLFDREGMLSCIEELVRRVAEGREEDVPDHAGPWLDRVQEAYFEEGEDLEPAEWFTSLRGVKSRLDDQRRNDHDGEHALARLGREARVHESGLGVLAEWLRSEEV